MQNKMNELIFCVLAIMLVACSEPAVDINSSIEVWFNYPELDHESTGKVSKLDFVTEEKLVDMVEASNPGSEIFISIYLMTRMDVPEALVRAARQRQVMVAIIVEDGWSTVTKKQKEIVKYLKNLTDQEGGKLIEVIKCKKGCNGRVINHNKFFLFSEVGADKDIVVQSSANLTDATGRLYENTVVIMGDKKLYEGYLDYWHDLASQIKDPGYFRSVEGDGYPSEGSAKVYFFPQKRGDQLLDILSEIHCDDSATSIKATASNWDSRRGFVAGLRDLAKQGCDVSVILPDNIKKADCDTRINMYPEVNVYTAHKLPHSKYLIVEGVYKGESKSVVWAGSHNYSMPSLRSTDETLLEINDKDVVAAFIENWEALLSHGTKDRFSGASNNAKNSCYEKYLQKVGHE